MFFILTYFVEQHILNKTQKVNNKIVKINRFVEKPCQYFENNFEFSFIAIYLHLFQTISWLWIDLKNVTSIYLDHKKQKNNKDKYI